MKAMEVIVERVAPAIGEDCDKTATWAGIPPISRAEAPEHRPHPMLLHTVRKRT